jgi:hypothetical protein
LRIEVFHRLFFAQVKTCGYKVYHAGYNFNHGLKSPLICLDISIKIGNITLNHPRLEDEGFSTYIVDFKSNWHLFSFFCPSFLRKQESTYFPQFFWIPVFTGMTILSKETL